VGRASDQTSEPTRFERAQVGESCLDASIATRAFAKASSVPIRVALLAAVELPHCMLVYIPNDFWDNSLPVVSVFSGGDER
jgi:hypothetical protein